MAVNIAALVKTAFTTVGSSVDGVVRTVTYRAAGAQVYNPTTGANATTFTDFPVPAIFVGYSRKEKETDFQNSRRQTIEFGDQKVLIAYSDLPLSPSMEDVFLDGTSTWRVINHSLDPTGKGLHTFQVRQS